MDDSPLFPKPLILGSRSSPLALIQAELVRAALLEAYPHYKDSEIEIKRFKTTGDKILNQKLSEIGGKGLFTKELEYALLEEEIHIAVHSLKDVAVRFPEGLELAAILRREAVEDVLIANRPLQTLEDLPKGAKIGTSSLRRQAQMKRLRPDIECVNLRGNIDTRLHKLRAGEMDAILLARAGLIRRGMAGVISYIFPVEEILPAPAQGAIALEICSKDRAIFAPLLAPLHSEETAYATKVERAFLAALDGSCQTPIAAHALLDKAGEKIFFRGEVYREDGSEFHLETHHWPKGEAAQKAYQLGQILRKTLPQKFWPNPNA